jgi:hypothetical protein
MGSNSLCKRLHVGSAAIILLVRPDAHTCLSEPAGVGADRDVTRPGALAIPMSYWLSRQHLRFASTHAYIAAMDLKFWKKALREADRELDAATTRTALEAAAKKLMRAKVELKRLQAEVSA